VFSPSFGIVLLSLVVIVVIVVVVVVVAAVVFNFQINLSSCTLTLLCMRSTWVYIMACSERTLWAGRDARLTRMFVCCMAHACVCACVCPQTKRTQATMDSDKLFQVSGANMDHDGMTHAHDVFGISHGDELVLTNGDEDDRLFFDMLNDVDDADFMKQLGLIGQPDMLCGDGQTSAASMLAHYDAASSSPFGHQDRRAAPAPDGGAISQAKGGTEAYAAVAHNNNNNNNSANNDDRKAGHGGLDTLPPMGPSDQGAHHAQDNPMTIMVMEPTAATTSYARVRVPATPQEAMAEMMLTRDQSSTAKPATVALRRAAAAYVINRHLKLGGEPIDMAQGMGMCASLTDMCAREKRFGPVLMIERGITAWLAARLLERVRPGSSEQVPVTPLARVGKFLARMYKAHDWTLLSLDEIDAWFNKPENENVRLLALWMLNSAATMALVRRHNLTAQTITEGAYPGELVQAVNKLAEAVASNAMVVLLPNNRRAHLTDVQGPIKPKGKDYMHGPLAALSRDTDAYLKENPYDIDMWAKRWEAHKQRTKSTKSAVSSFTVGSMTSTTLPAAAASSFLCAPTVGMSPHISRTAFAGSSSSSSSCSGSGGERKTKRQMASSVPVMKPSLMSLTAMGPPPPGSAPMAREVRDRFTATTTATAAAAPAALPTTETAATMGEDPSLSAVAIAAAAAAAAEPNGAVITSRAGDGSADGGNTDENSNNNPSEPGRRTNPAVFSNSSRSRSSAAGFVDGGGAGGVNDNDKQVMAAAAAAAANKKRKQLHDPRGHPFTAPADEESLKKRMWDMVDAGDAIGTFDVMAHYAVAGPHDRDQRQHTQRQSRENRDRRPMVRSMGALMSGASDVQTVDATPPSSSSSPLSLSAGSLAYRPRYRHHDDDWRRDTGGPCHGDENIPSVSRFVWPRGNDTGAKTDGSFRNVAAVPVDTVAMERLCLSDQRSGRQQLALSSPASLTHRPAAAETAVTAHGGARNKGQSTVPLESVPTIDAMHSNRAALAQTQKMAVAALAQARASALVDDKTTIAFMAPSLTCPGAMALSYWVVPMEDGTVTLPTALATAAITAVPELTPPRADPTCTEEMEEDVQLSEPVKRHVDSMANGGHHQRGHLAGAPRQQDAMRLEIARHTTPSSSGAGATSVGKRGDERHERDPRAAFAARDTDGNTQNGSPSMQGAPGSLFEAYGQSAVHGSDTLFAQRKSHALSVSMQPAKGMRNGMCDDRASPSVQHHRQQSCTFDPPFYSIDGRQANESAYRESYGEGGQHRHTVITHSDLIERASTQQQQQGSIARMPAYAASPTMYRDPLAERGATTSDDPVRQQPSMRHPPSAAADVPAYSYYNNNNNMRAQPKALANGVASDPTGGAPDNPPHMVVVQPPWDTTYGLSPSSSSSSSPSATRRGHPFDGPFYVPAVGSRAPVYM